MGIVFVALWIAFVFSIMWACLSYEKEIADLKRENERLRIAAGEQMQSVGDEVV